MAGAPLLMSMWCAASRDRGIRRPGNSVRGADSLARDRIAAILQARDGRVLGIAVRDVDAR